MDRRKTVPVVVALGLALACACRQPDAGLVGADGPSSVVALPSALQTAIRPLPPPPRLDPRQVALGRRLFSDPLLSHDGSLSCATCHDLERSGVDGRPRALGIRGQFGHFNTPTIYNAALNFRQFWDGRARSLEAQVEGPLTNPVEMGSTLEEVTAKVNGVPSYLAEVREAYGVPGFTASLLADAIATYERSLITLGSRFDRYLGGAQSTLDIDERHGYELFGTYGCVTCHQGANVGGNMFERFGTEKDYFAEVLEPSPADLGRFNLTGREEDRYVFRVPSLRLVTQTAPYLHDGRIPTLAETIRLMGRYQLGRELSDTDITLIEKFLRTLAGSAEEIASGSAG